MMSSPKLEDQPYAYKITPEASWSNNDRTQAESALFDKLKTAESSGQLESGLMNSLHTQAARYCLERRYSEAEHLYRRGLQVRERVLGCRHPDIVDSLERLAVVLQETKGKHEAMTVSFRAQTLAADIAYRDTMNIERSKTA